MYITDEQYDIGIKNGIKKSTIYHRVYDYGWDIEKAITVPPKSRADRSRKYPKEYTDLALKNGICLTTFYSRINTHGWSYEEAATRPLKNKKA